MNGRTAKTRLSSELHKAPRALLTGGSISWFCCAVGQPSQESTNAVFAFGVGYSFFLLTVWKPDLKAGAVHTKPRYCAHDSYHLHVC